jgi:hypothetical protein
VSGATYRRAIRLRTCAPGVVVGALEDSAHHVRVRLGVSDGVVQWMVGEAVRLPWTTCPGAAAGLQSLVGGEVTASLRQLRRRYDPTGHCTHMFDLAQLTLAHAASGRGERSYEAVVPPGGPPQSATLLRDGEVALEWSVEQGRIVAPEAFAGVPLGKGFLEWCEAHLDDDAGEAAFVLRRAASVSSIANMRMDDYAVVTESGLGRGVCFTAQPVRIDSAARNVGSQRDYSAGSTGMLAGFDEACVEQISG